MTIEECRQHLPEGWIEPIQNDPMLWEIFSEHEYDLEREPVPSFLIQSLRGGNLDRLRPIFSLYGQPGLEMLQGLLEIDDASRDTAETMLPNGQTGYAAYFYASSDLEEGARSAAVEAAKGYVQAIRQVYMQVFEEPAPVDDAPQIQILSGKEGRDFQRQMHQEYVKNQFHPGDEIYEDLGDWFGDLEMREECDELAVLLHEALYHINNDYFLSYYLQWPLLVPQAIENPFRNYFELWKMGVDVEFPEKDRVVLVAN